MHLAWPLRSWSAPHGPGRARSPAGWRLRTLATVGFVTIVVLALGAAITLVWSANESRTATGAMLDAVHDQALVDEASSSAATYRRLSDLWMLTGSRDVRRARDDEAQAMRRALQTARAEANGPERALLETAWARGEDYLAARARAEAQTRDLGAIIRIAHPYFDRFIATLGALQRLDRAEVAAAYGELDRASGVADGVAAGLVFLLIAAMLCALLGVRAWIGRPLLALHRAMERFRQGDMGARAPERGAREIGEVARAYNGMADTLRAQRDGQLTYLAGVAHDLRNPLHTIRLGLSVMEKDVATERSRRTIELMSRQVDRVTRMVDDLLDATRIEAGRLELSPMRIDLRERARDAVDVHAPIVANEIVLELPDEPVVVAADPGRIDQVLSNLVSNALKFSPGGGRVEVRCERRGREAIVEVEDHGIGMSEEDMRELFAPFRRSAPEVAPGAGLGLSIVRRIVEAHHGRVEVESERGLGSLFRVILPIAPDETRA